MDKDQEDIFEPERPSWDETFMDIVAIFAKRPVCINNRVACVYANPNHHIIDTGYNGPLPDHPHCNNPHVGCAKKHGNACRGLHAEDNATLSRSRSEFDGSTLYISRLCCTQCMKRQAAYGVKRIVFAQEYARVKRVDEAEKGEEKTDFELAIQLAMESNIAVEQYNYETKTTRKVI
ncbi:MAG TPA: hypothetical protein VJJ80_01165 [Patescibacteria group bacterium]|nr:hypothetical protein [Patescibacteria group bacterium]